jgi:RNA polymerase sigma-70 factor (ECF subfamily)
MELLERFAQGEDEAFEALFRQFQGEVFGWVMRIVRDRGVAEDLTAEAFWKMYRAHARFDPARSFGAWARRIATNLALDHLRKNRWETPIVGDLVAATRGNPGVQRETREQIAAAFGRLSPKLRLVATLALVEEVPHREIAEAAGISEATVRVRLFRATKILRKQLRGSGAYA